jgi:CysZ protein
MIFRTLMLSLQSLSDRQVMLILLKSILVTVIALAIFGYATWAGVSWVLALWFNGPEGVNAITAFVFTILISLLVWRVIAVAVMWFFSDDVVDAVERRHYPEMAKAGTRPNVAASGQMALRSIGRVIGYNLLALPFYIFLLFTGIGAPIAFLLVNALLLGRDLEDMLIARHGRDHAAFEKIPRLLLGLTGTAGMMLPFVNLLVPVVATAMAVHLTHLKKAK